MKRTLILTFICVLIASLVVGCGKQQEQEELITYSERTSYQETHLNLNVCYERATTNNDMIYGLYYKEKEPVIAYQNKQTGEIEKEIRLDRSLTIESMQADQFGNLYFVAEKDRFHKVYMINESDECVELSDICFDMEGEHPKGEAKGIYMDDQDNYYVWWSVAIPIETLFPEDGRKDGYVLVDQIYVLDNQFREVGCVQVPQFQGTRLLNFQLGQGGSALMLVRDENGIYTQKLTLEADNEEEKFYLDGVDYNNIPELFAASDQGMLYCHNGKLYEYNFETRVQEELLNLSTYGLLMEDLLYIGKNGEVLEIIDNYKEWGISEYTTLIPGVSNRKVLTLGVMMQSSKMQSIVAAFNRYSKDYTVDIVEYYNEAEEYTSAAEKLKLDIISGKAPDIIDVSAVDSSVFSSKGALVDLYSLMGQDEEFSKDRLMSSVIKAYETDGHLYALAPAFHLVTMWGNNDIIQDKAGVSLQELMNVLSAAGKSLNAIWGFSADEPVLTTLCTFGMDEFIDWDNKSCDFTGEYFCDVLRFVKNYSGAYTGSQSKGIQEGAIAMTTGMIDSVASYQITKELYGKDVAFIGYPTNSGSGTAVTFRELQLAINANKEYVEGAWEFVKFYILNGYQQEGFPVEKNQFEAIMSLAMQSEYFVDENGKTYEEEKGWYSDKDARISVYKASEEDVIAVRNLVDSVTNKFEYDIAIMQIISEEAEGYLQGDKSLEEVTKIIQNRVALYLSEN